jgi:2-oxo-4-hydroxy-4-carboxy-5-ureidoimidazoline decarboxylase
VDDSRGKPAAGGLGWLNAAPAAELGAALRACCAADSWVARVSDGRPYADEDALYASSGAATAALDDTGLGQALAGHPRIGDRPAGHGSAGQGAAWSRQEQAGVTGAGDDLLGQLAAANAAYEARFGHVYLVCAAGRSAAELLAVCRSRLGNDPATERGVVLGELAKINQLRLRKLLAPDSPR